jgi:uncharacterized protein YbjT (DUF2867 family)
MKIVVIGGTGVIGARLVERLRAAGHEALPASPSTGVDAYTGEGVADALRGADVVVDVANAPVWEDAAVLDFFTTSSRTLLAAEAAAGVGHHVAISIVGCDRDPEGGYLRAKQAQEGVVREGDVPFTILRATQFFEFVGTIADASTDGDTVRLAPARMRPVAADDVVAVLADLVAAGPINAVLELAGPEALPLSELATRVLQARGDDRTVVADPDAGYFGMRMDDTTLNPLGESLVGPTTFDAWLERSAARA